MFNLFELAIDGDVTLQTFLNAYVWEIIEIGD